MKLARSTPSTARQSDGGKHDRRPALSRCLTKCLTGDLVQAASGGLQLNYSTALTNTVSRPRKSGIRPINTVCRPRNSVYRTLHIRLAIGVASCVFEAAFEWRFSKRASKAIFRART